MILGKNGVERVVELELDNDDKENLDGSYVSVQSVLDNLNNK